MTTRRTAIVSAVAVSAVLVVGGLFVLPALSGQTNGPADAPATDETAPTDVNGTVVYPVNDSLVLETRSNESIEGATDVAAGATVTVRIKSESGDSPFIYQQQTTVRDDGTFAVPADLSGVPENATATVSVRHDGEELTNRTAQVVYVPGATAADGDDASVAGTRLDYDGENLTVRSATDQTIRGTTDLEPGTKVTVRARSSGSSTPFLHQRTATVGDDGTFAVTMDFESIPAGTRFEVSVHHGDETLTEADARVE